MANTFGREGEAVNSERWGTGGREEIVIRYELAVSSVETSSAAA